VKVQVVNRNGSYVVNERLLIKIVHDILRCYSHRECAQLEIVLLSDKDIRSFNKKYKSEDRSTDVLSFDLTEDAKTPLIGNIFISIDKALENSKIFKTKLEEEFTLYVIHGILHLTGYDDQTKFERLKMERKQSGILEKICTKINLSKVLMPR
jgi:probable rRNA maturation factor